MPCDYKKYPKNWKTEIRPAVLERDGNRCKFCGVGNGQYGFRDKQGLFNNVNTFITGGLLSPNEYREIAKQTGLKLIKIVITIMHLDHNIQNNDLSNLAAGCQKCHLNYDKDHHKANSRNTRNKKKKLQSLF